MKYLLKTSALISITAIVIFGCASFVTKTDESDKKKKPNVIFVFTDDQRFNSLGMTGDPVTETPHIDQCAFFETKINKIDKCLVLLL